MRRNLAIESDRCYINHLIDRLSSWQHQLIERVNHPAGTRLARAEISAAACKLATSLNHTLTCLEGSRDCLYKFAPVFSSKDAVGVFREISFIVKQMDVGVCPSDTLISSVKSKLGEIENLVISANMRFEDISWWYDSPWRWKVFHALGRDYFTTSVEGDQRIYVYRDHQSVTPVDMSLSVWRLKEFLIRNKFLPWLVIPPVIFVLALLWFGK